MCCLNILSVEDFKKKFMESIQGIATSVLESVGNLSCKYALVLLLKL